jgi:hypothetical protein
MTVITSLDDEPVNVQMIQENRRKLGTFKSASCSNGRCPDSVLWYFFGSQQEKPEIRPTLKRMLSTISNY